MGMIQIGILGVAGTLMAIQLQKECKEYALIVGMVIAVVIFFQILNKVEFIIVSIQEIESVLHIDVKYIDVIMKMLGITYISEFASGICKDAGYGNISTQIEMFAKISILALSMPILMAILETLKGMLT